VRLPPSRKSAKPILGCETVKKRDKLNAEAKKEIAASSVTTIHQLAPAQHKAGVAAMHPVWKKFENQIGKEIVAAAVKSNEAPTD
jgi:C4-dicarboxylate-binding protein DctP